MKNLHSTTKYKRSLHADISLGTTSDDRFMPPGYFKAFQKMDLVLLEKLDGQNNCFTKDGLFARSHVQPSELPWDVALRQRHKLIKNDLKEIQIFGEGMYGQHSIGYKDLESYFYVFGARIGDEYASWEDTKIIAEMFDFPTVPEIPIKPLIEFNNLDEALTDALGMSWIESTQTSGKLDGYNLITGEPASEGFVLRNSNSFREDNKGSLLEKEVYVNEFADLLKLVRENHVKTDEHWTKHWTASPLKEYSKYSWDSFNYLSKR